MKISPALPSYVIKSLYIALAVGFFFLLFTALDVPLQPMGYALETWQMEKSGSQQEIRLPYIERIEQSVNQISLRTHFPRLAVDTLVLPRPCGNAFQVRLNGALIHQTGDMDTPTANLWNSIHLIQLPPNLPAENTLEIRLISVSFCSGISAVPYLGVYPQLIGWVMLKNWIYSELVIWSAGAAFIVGLISIFMANIRRQKFSVELFMGLALLFSVIYAQDMVFRLTTGSLTAFLTAKKVFMISGYLASIAFVLGMEKYLIARLSLSRWVVIPTAVSILVLALAPTLIALSSILQFTNLALSLNLLAAALLILGKYRNQPWLLMIMVLLSLSLLQMAAAIPLRWTNPLVAPYIILFSTVLFGVRLIIEFSRLYQENILLQRDAQIDPLTGALNRRVLRNLHIHLHDYLVMIDLDRLKTINDTLGHALGDQLLIHFTRTAKRNLRQNDLIIRLGGDEFLLVLDYIPKTPAGLAEVKAILERIQQQLAADHPDLRPSFSYGIAAAQETLEETLELADQKMYAMKKKTPPPGN